MPEEHEPPPPPPAEDDEQRDYIYEPYVYPLPPPPQHPVDFGRMVSRKSGECIGGGGTPARRTEQRESDSSTTGECPVCAERFRLDRDGLIPKHQLPERFASRSANPS